MTESDSWNDGWMHRKNGVRRIVFFGDSITHSGWYLYLFQLYCLCRFSGCDIICRNAGVSGQTLTAALERIDRDVMSMQPDLTVIAFGINDVGRELYQPGAGEKNRTQRREALDLYRSSLRKAVALLRGGGSRVVCMTPPAYDEYRGGDDEIHCGCNQDGLKTIVDIIFEEAKKLDFKVIDIHAPLTRLYSGHPELAIALDRVHPDRRGHVVMAAAVAGVLFPQKTPSASEQGFSFPLLPECRDIAPFADITNLYSAGRPFPPEYVKPVMTELGNLEQAVFPMRTLVQFDEKIRARGGNPSEYSSADIILQDIYEECPLCYKDYYSKFIAVYQNDRNCRCEIQNKISVCRHSFFESIQKMKGIFNS